MHGKERTLMWYLSIYGEKNEMKKTYHNKNSNTRAKTVGSEYVTFSTRIGCIHKI